jgi:hypothetical protein
MPSLRQRNARFRAPLEGSVPCDAAAAILCIVALSVALTATRGVTTPSDWDHFRDVAHARTVLDGHPLSDPFYAGEWTWYNPLTAWLLAIGAKLTRLDPAAVHAASGPWLNLLAPISLYLLVRRLFGALAALPALAAHLLLACANPAWAAATYNAWLWPCTWAQGLFYLTVLALMWAVEAPTVARAIAVGIAIGITFLGHSAPGLLLAILACALLPARAFVTAGVAAAVVSAPFLYPLVAEYQFHVLNAAPLAFVWEGLKLRTLPDLFVRNAPLIVLGVTGLFHRRDRFISVWLGAATVLLTLGIIRDELVTMGAVSTFHFWIYVTAALSILTGVAVASLARRPALVIFVTAAAIAASAPTYWRISAEGRAAALGIDPNYAEAARLLRSLTPADRLVLAEPYPALFIVGPSGRKTVAMDVYFSNPYVELAPRQQTRDRMFAAMRAADSRTFTMLADKNAVSVVLVVGAEQCNALSSVLSLQHRLGDICIASVTGQSAGT